jgi:hypothetical protein
MTITIDEVIGGTQGVFDGVFASRKGFKRKERKMSPQASWWKKGPGQQWHRLCLNHLSTTTALAQ